MHIIVRSENQKKKICSCLSRRVHKFVFSNLKAPIYTGNNKIKTTTEITVTIFHTVSHLIYSTIQGHTSLNQFKTNQLFVYSTWKANKKLQHHFEHSFLCQIPGAYSARRPPAVFYHSRFMLALWETQPSKYKMARAISA